jgi:signal peptidase I
VGDYLFVSKTSYGPKLPNTPVAFPFVHHTMPFTAATRSFSEVIHNDYRRLAGFGKVKNDDVVVFNFPEGDTVCTNMQERSYYDLVRSYGRERVVSDKRSFGDIIYRPVDKRENYIKRCIAIAGDSLKIESGKVYVNGKLQKEIPGIQNKYLITIQGNSLNPNAMEKLDITPEDIEGSGSRLVVSLTSENYKKLEGMKFVTSKEQVGWSKDERDPSIFPSDEQYTWNLDNFGPIWVPKKGTTIQLSTKNLPLYKRIIDVYEENDLAVRNGEIYINGAMAKDYTFKMDYFWMMGDNRYNSADSRFWGFVPEDHVVGKASFVWLSLDKNKSFLSKIRWNRFFMGVK